MSHQIGPSEFLHELNIVATALAAAAERIHMLLRVIDGQVDQPVRIRQLQRLCRLLQTDAASRPLLNFFVRHIVRIKTGLQRIVAPFVLCPAVTVCQRERSGIAQDLKHLLRRQNPL
jgi:hypothetical protein